jgi:hypothetical protein
MQIRQLSVNYLPEQDRILLRINTAASEEMRLWLTRRLMAGLWPLLNQLTTRQLLQSGETGSAPNSTDDHARRMLTDFRREQFLREADFETPYEEKPAVLPLGPEPLLVTDVDATPLANGGLQFQFHERRPQGQEQRNFQMQTEPQLMQGLMHLMEKALQRSQWLGPFGAPSGDDHASPAGANLPSAPRYLN